jgi:hypothetical protein
MVDRFTTTLDCVDVTFIGDGLLDQLPAPSQIGATRVGGVDVNKPRIRAALSAALALSTAPDGFTVTEFTTKVHTMTRTDRRRLHHPPRRLRPTQAARQRPDHQTRPNPPIPNSNPRCQHHRSPSHPTRPDHQPHPGRCPQPTTRTQTHHLDPRRPRLRGPPHPDADPLPRPRHHHPRSRRSIDNFLSIGVPQAGYRVPRDTEHPSDLRDRHTFRPPQPTISAQSCTPNTRFLPARFKPGSSGSWSPLSCRAVVSMGLPSAVIWHVDIQGGCPRCGGVSVSACTRS